MPRAAEPPSRAAAAQWSFRRWERSPAALHAHAAGWAPADQTGEQIAQSLATAITTANQAPVHVRVVTTCQERDEDETHVFGDPGPAAVAGVPAPDDR